MKPPACDPTGLDPADAARLLAAAADILLQGTMLLAALDAQTYGSRVPAAFNASIGEHYRHCLDHWTSWTLGLDGELLDYDHRQRDPRLETDPACALAQTRDFGGLLSGLDPAALAKPIRTRCEVSYEPGTSPVTASSCGRELAYVIAHAIHHYALIGVMARLLEVPLPKGFGIAPSTLEHQRQQAASETS